MQSNAMIEQQHAQCSWADTRCIAVRCVYLVHTLLFCDVWALISNWGEREQALNLWWKQKIVYICVWVCVTVYVYNIHIYAYSIYPFGPICAWHNISTFMFSAVRTEGAEVQKLMWQEIAAYMQLRAFNEGRHGGGIHAGWAVRAVATASMCYC